MGTYGDIRFRITKQFPDLDPDLISAWIDDRYQAVLDTLPWQRLHKDAVLQTVAPYSTGTVEVTAGSNAVTGTGTAWTAGMSGRYFRVGGRDEIYTFTRTGNTTATLDRNYEGDTDADATYSVFQHIYALPSDCRILESIDYCDKISREELNVAAPYRTGYGTPTFWCPRMDDTSTPPAQQVELYPIPDAAIGMPYQYIAEKTDLSAGSTNVALLAWMRPAVIEDGVRAKCLAHLKDYTGAQLAKVDTAEGLARMVQEEARRKGPTNIRMAPRFTRHRVTRWSR